MKIECPNGCSGKEGFWVGIIGDVKIDKNGDPIKETLAWEESNDDYYSCGECGAQIGWDGTLLGD